MISNFFKTRKPKRFDFKARYYDAEKEEFEKRVEMSRWEAENPEHPVVNFRKQWEEKGRHRANQGSNKRILIIASALFFLLYFMYRFL
jgi:hypothetical protein